MSGDKVFDPAKAAKLDKPERQKDLPPEKLVELLEPFQGMVFADIGTGTGYSFFPMVDAAQGIGMFYALDSQQPMLDLFNKKMVERGLTSGLIHPLLTPADSIALPDNTLDRMIMCFVYHEVPNRAAYAEDIVRVLKPGGRLVIVDWIPPAPDQEPTKGPPADHRVSVDQAVDELKAAGFASANSVNAFEDFWSMVAVTKD